MGAPTVPSKDALRGAADPAAALRPPPDSLYRDTQPLAEAEVDADADTDTDTPPARSPAPVTSPQGDPRPSPHACALMPPAQPAAQGAAGGWGRAPPFLPGREETGAVAAAGARREDGGPGGAAVRRGEGRGGWMCCAQAGRPVVSRPSEPGGRGNELGPRPVVRIFTVAPRPGLSVRGAGGGSAGRPGEGLARPPRRPRRISRRSM